MPQSAKDVPRKLGPMPYPRTGSGTRRPLQEFEKLSPRGIHVSPVWLFGILPFANRLPPNADTGAFHCFRDARDSLLGMSLYLVSYDISSNEDAYQPLYDLLEGWEGKRVLYSEWLLTGKATNNGAAREEIAHISEEIQRVTHKGDGHLVIELTSIAAYSNLKINDRSFDIFFHANVRRCE